MFEPSCYSEHGELKAVMLAPPSKLDVPNQQIADEVKWSQPVHYKKAEENFNEMKQAFEDAGVQVLVYTEELLEEDQTLSDQLINRIFVRDLACTIGKRLIPGAPSISMRKPEFSHAQPLLKKWFPQAYAERVEDQVHALECGDVFVLNPDAVWVNIGRRTSRESIEQIMSLIFQEGFSEIGVIDLPRKAETLHLDMNVNVGDETLIIAKHFVRYFPVMTRYEKTKSRYEMPNAFLKRHGFEVHWLDHYETNPDINFVNLDPETLLMSKKADNRWMKNHPIMQKKKIIEVDVSELEKAGGGLRCMTLPLLRKA